jgi:hypothetical protein
MTEHVSKYDQVFRGISGRQALDPNKVFHMLEETGTKLVDAQKAHSQLKNAKKAVLARIAATAGGSSVAAREQWALASEDWKTFLNGLAEAEHEENKCKIQHENVKTLADLRKSEQSLIKELIDKGFLIK